MIQIFIRIIFWSIGRQEKRFDFLFVLFQPGRNKLAMMNLKIIQFRNTFCFEARTRRSMKQTRRCWFTVS